MDKLATHFLDSNSKDCQGATPSSLLSRRLPQHSSHLYLHLGIFVSSFRLESFWSLLLAHSLL
jgi:hypothetical protein